MSTRTALTTGANSGLGLATALEMARRGHRSVGTVRSEQKADVVRKAAKEAGVEVETLLLDITDAPRCQEVVDTVKPDVLVNNAGYLLLGAIEDVADDDATAILNTMVVSPMRLARLCVPHMRAKRWGRVIQISSILAISSVPLLGWYQAAKKALEGASDALRLEVASDGISVVLIEPGVFRSEITETFDEMVYPPKSRYADAYETNRTAAARFERFMTDTGTVARAVVGAAEARRPNARYPVGLDARTLAVASPLIPQVVQDIFLRRTSNL